jgi:DNA-binding beta-propeller fold protein YncE
MLEVARVEVGAMPHGARLNAAEDRLYAVTMMSGELIETDAWGFEVTRRLSLGGHAMPGGEGASPTWVEPAPDGHLWVAVGGADEIREIDPIGWEVVRTLEAPGAYNLAVSPDGRWMVATYRNDGEIGIWALGEGREMARIRSSRDLPHGIAISPDSRYAFVSIEGVGGEPGRVEVVDLAAGERVATVDIGAQASGIAFWKQEAGPP